MKLYIKCDNCEKECELNSELYFTGYLDESIEVNAYEICCSIKCLEEIKN